MTKANDPVEMCAKLMSRLPGIGTRSARRLIYHMLERDRTTMRELGVMLQSAANDVEECGVCGIWRTPNTPCISCDNTKRDASIICVVATVQDMQAIDGSGASPWSFHILHGLLSPLDGIGPDDLRVHTLLQRIHTMKDELQEVVLATPPNSGGEATAMYLSGLLKNLNIRVTRIASGIPVGEELHFVDRLTLSSALSARREC